MFVLVCRPDLNRAEIGSQIVSSDRNVLKFVAIMKEITKEGEREQIAFDNAIITRDISDLSRQSQDRQPPRRVLGAANDLDSYA